MQRRFFIQTLLTTSATLLYPAKLFADILEGEDRTTVTLYDTYAQALYMDGGLGPTTGIIKVDYVLKNEPVKLQFWHGHGGINHTFIVTPDHFSELKKLKRVYIETDSVADHTHKLFIEPKDPKWRVPGAPPVEVPIDGMVPYFVNE